jgi:hypothetical protein
VGRGGLKAKDDATVKAHRTYRVLYHVGDTLNLRTKALEGRVALTQDAITITGPSLAGYAFGSNPPAILHYAFARCQHVLPAYLTRPGAALTSVHSPRGALRG